MLVMRCFWFLACIFQVLCCYNLVVPVLTIIVRKKLLLMILNFLYIFLLFVAGVVEAEKRSSDCFKRLFSADIFKLITYQNHHVWTPRLKQTLPVGYAYANYHFSPHTAFQKKRRLTFCHNGLMYIDFTARLQASAVGPTCCRLILVSPSVCHKLVIYQNG